MHGWANRILRVDLSDMRIWAQETAPYVPDYLGARGIAARICWDEYPEPVAPFDPANPLMIMTGALTGSRSPYSGRTNVCAFSPQAFPYPWFTRSSVGSHFGGELKRAGYDGIVVTGASETPVRVRIRDDEVSILPADDLWGMDALETLEALESTEGEGVRAFVIGPAGECLSRIATIQTTSSSAAGQGGFGGVMGSKKLKAISVRGSGRVSLAHPERMTQIARAVASAVKRGPAAGLEDLNRELTAAGQGRAGCHGCTEGCLTPCESYLEDVPGVVYRRKWTAGWFCISWIRGPGIPESGPASMREVYDWYLEPRAAFEVNVLTNHYGLNQYELLMGLVPWLIACQKAGLISELNGRPMDWYLPHFWVNLLRTVAYREGLGDALAEGGWAAARALHLGEDLVRTRYPAWGHAAHWDGHDSPTLPFPSWLVSALQWLFDTRDPFDSGHGYVWWASAVRRAALLAESEAERAAVIERARSAGERVYGDADALDPYSGYRGKARPAHFHTLRSVIKDCVPVDDFAFPLLRDDDAADGLCVLREIEGIGDIPGPSVEYHLFSAGTGVPWPEEEFNRAVERVCALERALQVRHWGRDRRTDELVLPYFERTEFSANPLLGERYGLDREQFGPVMDEFYRLHGWDPATARPTPERLGELGLGDLYEPMVAGAEWVKASGE